MSEERIVEFDMGVVSERLKANRTVIFVVTAVVTIASVVYTYYSEPG